MTQPPHVPDVGAQDPELRNSPIAEEMCEESEDLRHEVPGEPACYFNNESYPHGDYVRSGSELLGCDYGIWISAGPSDLDFDELIYVKLDQYRREWEETARKRR